MLIALVSIAYRSFENNLDGKMIMVKSFLRYDSTLYTNSIKHVG